MPLFSCRCVSLAVMSGTTLKTKDTSASSWLLDFVSYFLARYKNENTLTAVLFDTCFSTTRNFNSVVFGK